MKLPPCIRVEMMESRVFVNICFFNSIQPGGHCRCRARTAGLLAGTNNTRCSKQQKRLKAGRRKKRRKRRKRRKGRRERREMERRRRRKMERRRRRRRRRIRMGRRRRNRRRTGGGGEIVSLFQRELKDGKSMWISYITLSGYSGKKFLLNHLRNPELLSFKTELKTHFTIKFEFKQNRGVFRLPAF